jgi:hypothetical protein
MLSSSFVFDVQFISKCGNREGVAFLGAELSEGELEVNDFR